MRSTLAILASITSAFLLISSSARAGDPSIACEVGKLKEAAKYGSCRLKADAKSVTSGAVADYSNCESKFSLKWTGIEAKAGLGVCPSEADYVEIDERIVGHAADVATLLSGGSVPTCGNGSRDGGEQCDGSDLGGETCGSLGYASGTLSCTAGCSFNVGGCVPVVCPPPDLCGNGVVDPGEECDWGTAVSVSCSDVGFNAGEVTCTPDTCELDTSGCFVGCNATNAYALCGSPSLDPACSACIAADQACDYIFDYCDSPSQVETCAERLNDAGCGAVCCPMPKKVFVTGVLDGTEGVAYFDTYCNGSALGAGLTGTYKAWVSTATAGPATTFTHSSGAYVRVDGVVVANSWADLTDGTLAAPINVSAYGQAAVGGDVWTNTKTDGTPANTAANPALDSCSDWTTLYENGWIGNSAATNGSWTYSGDSGLCWLDLNYVYCFEQ